MATPPGVRWGPRRGPWRACGCSPSPLTRAPLAIHFHARCSKGTPSAGSSALSSQHARTSSKPDALSSARSHGRTSSKATLRAACPILGRQRCNVASSGMLPINCGAGPASCNSWRPAPRLLSGLASVAAFALFYGLQGQRKCACSCRSNSRIYRPPNHDLTPSRWRPRHHPRVRASARVDPG